MYLFLQSNIVNLVSFVFMEVLEINEKYWKVAEIVGIANGMTTVTKHHKSGQQLFSPL